MVNKKLSCKVCAGKPNGYTLQNHTHKRHLKACERVHFSVYINVQPTTNYEKEQNGTLNS